MNNRPTHNSIHIPQDLARELVRRQLQGDHVGMAALYEPNAVLDCGNGRLAVGRAAIGSFYAELIATGVQFNVGNQRPAIVNGDLALTSTRLPEWQRHRGGCSQATRRNLALGHRSAGARHRDHPSHNHGFLFPPQHPGEENIYIHRSSGPAARSLLRDSEIFQ